VRLQVERARVGAVRVGSQEQYGALGHRDHRAGSGDSSRNFATCRSPIAPVDLLSAPAYIRSAYMTATRYRLAITTPLLRWSGPKPSGAPSIARAGRARSAACRSWPR